MGGWKVKRKAAGKVADCTCGSPAKVCQAMGTYWVQCGMEWPTGAYWCWRGPAWSVEVQAIRSWNLLMAAAKK